MISLYASAIKIQFWQEIYERLNASNEPFELIFAGFNPPDFVLPDNFKFIYTRAKSATAAEMARRECKGDFIIPAVDDWMFPTNMLKLFMNEYNQLEDKKTMISAWYGNQWMWVSEATHRLNANDPDLILPLFPMLSVEYQKIIGGIDKRFNVTMWDLDLYLRFRRIGGKLKFVGRPAPETLVGNFEFGRESVQTDDCVIVWEKPNTCTYLNNPEHMRLGGEDHLLFRQLWGADGRLERTTPVEEYSDEELKKYL